MNVWNNAGKPVLVLVLVCLLSGIILSSANLVTAPVIAANEAEAGARTCRQALSEADSFTAVDCGISGVTAALRADNGAGWVITAQSRGYGGQVPAAVAFSPEGTIRSVVMMSNEETPGLGQKVTEEAFSGQFAGMPAESFSLEDIDAVSGATISSRASVNAVNLAIQAYHQLTGGAA